MNALLHWHETNPGTKPAPSKPKRKHSAYHHGPMAKIVFDGVTYKTWDEACKATGKTKDAIRWAMKRAAA